MPPRSALITTGAALAAVALAATACTSSGSNSSAPQQSSHPAMSHSAMSSSSPMSGMSSSSSGASGDTTATAAATLRAGLDTLLREHVDLTAFAVQTAVADGLSSPNTAQALKVVNQNTLALGKAIGSVYGAAAQKQFDKIWTAHIGFFVNYTKGLATHDQALVNKSQKQLAGYKKEFSAFVASATKLPAAAVAADLQGHIQTLEAAIKAIVTKSPSAGAAVQMAAMHMDGTAEVLAKGIASDKHLAGNPEGQASGLRAALTGLLIQHVAQTTQLVQTAVETGLTSSQTAASVKALDQNTVDLGTAIGSLYGKSAQTEFLKIWRAHIGFFVTYTKGLATKNQAMVSKAQKQLAGYKTDFAKFMASATGLPAAAVATDLQGHIATLEAAIKAIVTKSPDAAAMTAIAETHMAGTAAVLAKGIAAQKHLK